MSRDADTIMDAIDRWEAAGRIDEAKAAELRADVSERATAQTGLLAQYLLAFTGAVVLVLAGGVFLDWAWPHMDAVARSGVLALLGVAVLTTGMWVETRAGWRPAGYLMQTGGLGLMLAAYVHSGRALESGSPIGTLLGVVSLAIPIVLAGRAMRRDPFMPAVHMTMSLAFLAVFLDRSTPLGDDAVIWTLDLVLLAGIAVFAQLLRADPDGERHPWALHAFVWAMGAGFVLVTLTAVETLDLSEDAFLALDAWLALSVAVTLWGVHRAPPGLRRAWFSRVLALEALGWIFLGLATTFGTFDWEPEAALVLVGGVGVVAFLHADRHGFQELMVTASLAFIIPVWWWAVDRAGALGGAGALVATAAFLFWASGRRGRRRAAYRTEASASVNSTKES